MRYLVLLAVIGITLWLSNSIAQTTAQSDPDKQTGASRTLITVALDGTGDFKHVQEAIDSIPLSNDHPITIHIKPGWYYEKLMVRAPFVRLLGSGSLNTTITFDDYATKLGPDGNQIGTNASHTLFIKADDFIAENLTIENTAGPQRITRQTMALGVRSDRAVFRHCSLLGHQDTLFAQAGRQDYDDCLICGGADFIFGAAAAVFDHCEIRSNHFGSITAQERTSPDAPSGFVFTQCQFTSTPDVKKASVYLGRPFRPYARVVLLNCALGDHISPDGWRPVLGTTSDKTCYFAEFNSNGPGADDAKRVPWSRKLTADAGKTFSTRGRIQKCGWLAAADG